ncbi:hypothetical protein EJ08DRAFT_682903 [Tothia fuscella]|uniref:Uncharacterized protein n=1 Tax=Tothia fuscella TaxID=1048955 RepID=A0A9P4NH60_9PEZI|nr:hypothetical protein EJ08DRAFT_682903 [Tothia fuscella]
MSLLFFLVILNIHFHNIYSFIFTCEFSSQRRYDIELPHQDISHPTIFNHSLSMRSTCQTDECTAVSISIIAACGLLVLTLFILYLRRRTERRIAAQIARKESDENYVRLRNIEDAIALEQSSVKAHETGRTTTVIGEMEGEGGRHFVELDVQGRGPVVELDVQGRSPVEMDGEGSRRGGRMV